MALPPLVTVADLEIRLGLDVGSISGVDLARAEAALDDVSALVREEAGKTWVDTDLVTITAPASVLAVARNASLRIYRNPDGLVTENLGNGAYSYSLSQDSVVNVLTDDERRIVRKAAIGAAARGGYTLRTPSAYFDPVTETTEDLLP